MRDARQLGEQLHPRALRAIKDTVRGMRVAYRCPSGTVRNKLVREIGSRGAAQVRVSGVGVWLGGWRRLLVCASQHTTPLDAPKAARSHIRLPVTALHSARKMDLCHSLHRCCSQPGLGGCIPSGI